MTDGKALFDLVHSLSGKKMSGMSSPSALAAHTEDRVRYLHRQYLDFINHLESMGGMMCSVRAELLLSEEELRVYHKQRIDQLVCIYLF